jgi:type I restriction enzyme S subunit
MITKLKFVAQCLDGRRIPLNASQRGEMQGEHPYWGANGIVDHIDSWIFDEELVLLGEDGAPFFDPFKDVSFAVSGKIWVNNHAHILRPSKQKVVCSFLSYSLNAVQYQYYISGSTRDKLTQSDMGDIFLYQPDVAEQAQIAAFLDHETVKIDRLIEKQEKLIELLKEKRQAVISHAVTKGLDPNAPMKDSGVEWLGEIPAHWEIYKFSHFASIRNGQVDPREAPFDEYALIAPNHIESETGKLIKIETASEQGADSGKYVCRRGEVIYSKIRPALAKACLCPIENALCSADMYPISTSPVMDEEYLWRLLLSPGFTALASMESDRVAMPKINRESLNALRFPLPPITEQLSICAYVKEETEKIDLVYERATSVIALLQERRTALISAAVTGKIDVREWQPEQAS